MSPNKNCSCIFTKIFCKIFKRNKNKKVAHLTLSGVIGKDSKFETGINFINNAPLIKKAFESKKISAVALSINSPGGSPVQSELIYNYIRELAEKNKIPVYIGYFTAWVDDDGAINFYKDIYARDEQLAAMLLEE